MRRSIDDAQIHEADLPADDEDVTPLSWAVAISDDYDDAECRVVLTVEPIGAPGTGLVAHFGADHTRRLRGALHDALRELGEDPGR
jgi:hypothetical protein